MRMVMERGCPDGYRTTELQSRVRALEAHLRRLEDDLEMLRLQLAAAPYPVTIREVPHARSS